MFQSLAVVTAKRYTGQSCLKPKFKKSLQENLRYLSMPMHGAAACGLAQLLGDEGTKINSDRDHLFVGGAPEPVTLPFRIYSGSSDSSANK